MKRRSWIYLIIALIVFIFALRAFVSDTGRRGSAGMREHTRFSAQGDVDYFELTSRGEHTMRFSKADDNTWLLNDSFAVDPLAVEDMLTLLARMQLRSPVGYERREQVQDELDESGITVKLYAKSYWVNLPGNTGLFARKKKLHEVIIGTDLVNGFGAYVSAGKGKMPFVAYIPGTNKAIGAHFSMEKHVWADPVVISVLPAEIKRVEVLDYANSDESFQLVIDESDFYFLNNAEKKIDLELINKEKLSRFVNSFRQLRHERKMPFNDNCTPNDVLAGGPFLYVAVASVSGDVYELEFFRRKRPDDGTLVSDRRDFDPNRFYLKTGDCDYSKAQYYIFQPIMRPLSYFLNN